MSAALAACALLCWVLAAVAYTETTVQLERRPARDFRLLRFFCWVMILVAGTGGAVVSLVALIERTMT